MKGNAYYEQHLVQNAGEAGTKWPRFFLLVSSISMGLIIGTSILNFMTLNIGFSTFFLDAYLIMLCFFALSAELRQVNFLRRHIYRWIKYLYFLTTYTGRSFFYVLLGTLVFGGSILRWIAAVLAIALGLMMFVVNICVTLPVYFDPQVALEEDEAAAAQRAAVWGTTQTLFESGFLSSPSPQAEKNFTSATKTTGVNAAAATAAGAPRADGFYRPSNINEGPNAL